MLIDIATHAMSVNNDLYYNNLIIHIQLLLHKLNNDLTVVILVQPKQVL